MQELESISRMLFNTSNDALKAKFGVCSRIESTKNLKLGFLGANNFNAYAGCAMDRK